MSDTKTAAIEEPRSDMDQLVRVVRQIKQNLENPRSFAARLDAAIDAGLVDTLNDAQSRQISAGRGVSQNTVRINSMRADIDQNSESIGELSSGLEEVGDHLDFVSEHSPNWMAGSPLQLSDGALMSIGETYLSDTDLDDVRKNLTLPDPVIVDTRPHMEGVFDTRSVSIQGDGENKSVLSQVATFWVPVSVQRRRLNVRAWLGEDTVLAAGGEDSYATVNASMCTMHDRRGYETEGILFNILARNVMSMSDPSGTVKIRWQVWG